jgi:murein DD-endopeptidase MepM/ murein hydrolase activator NlpD
MAIYKEPFKPSVRGDEFGNMASYRTHPHRGMDWHPAEKTPIPAVTDGKIMKVFWSDVLGNCVIQSGKDKFYILYAHLAHKSALEVGQEIKMGQIIGLVGGGKNTPSGSASTGAHLHMSIAPMSAGIDIHLVDYSKLVDPLKHILANPK